MPYDFLMDSDRLHLSIGKIVVKFQQIENEVAEVLASLLEMRDPEDTHRITASMSYKQKLNLMCDLYESRKNKLWPSIDLKKARKALLSAEVFRNAVVHSFWFVGGVESQWMRSKASIQSKGKLSIVTGIANIEALEEAVNCLVIISDWYLGRTTQLADATKRLDDIFQELSTS